MTLSNLALESGYLAVLELASELRSLPLKMAWETLQRFRLDRPDHDVLLLRLDAVADLIPLLELVREADMLDSYADFEMPGTLTVNKDPHQAAIDDMMCSVFHDPSVVRLVANKLGFQYLEEYKGTFPEVVIGLIHGMLNRVVVPIVVEGCMLVKNSTDPHPTEKLHIVMMYDTGSSLTYLTKEVLTALHFEELEYVDLKHPVNVKTYNVRLNGRAMNVGLCPKERCEHVCLLGQDYFMDYGLVSEINYRDRTVTIKVAMKAAIS
jgi:hypothetical protein